MPQYEVTKRDWKLFREKLPDWQEAYMEKLVKEYMELLAGEGLASDKFWELEKRIKKDKKDPGVILEMSKSNMLFDLYALLRDGAITMEDLEEFSDNVRESVKSMADRWLN